MRREPLPLPATVRGDSVKQGLGTGDLTQERPSSLKAFLCAFASLRRNDYVTATS